MIFSIEDNVSSWPRCLFLRLFSRVDCLGSVQGCQDAVGFIC
jgi:hypothetical protein